MRLLHLSLNLWTAPIYPEKDTIKEAVKAALKLYEAVMDNNWSSVEPGKSLAAGFNDADPKAILHGTNEWKNWSP